jgi:hypothetical protein
MERTMRLPAAPQRVENGIFEICMEGHKKLGSHHQILEAPSDESVRSNYKAVPFLVGVTWAVPGSRNARLGVSNDSTTVAALRDLQFSHGLAQVRSCRAIRTHSGNAYLPSMPCQGLRQNANFVPVLSSLTRPRLPLLLHRLSLAFSLFVIVGF